MTCADAVGGVCCVAQEWEKDRCDRAHGVPAIHARIKAWNFAHVEAWLSSHGLGDYAPRFHDITGKVRSAGAVPCFNRLSPITCFLSRLCPRRADRLR